MSSGRSRSLDPAVDLGHGGVVGVVIRIVRDERPLGRLDVLDLRDRPQLPVAEATRAALALDLNGTEDLVSLGRDAVTIGMHHAVVPVVVELEDGQGPDGLADPGFPAHRSPDPASLSGSGVSRQGSSGWPAEWNNPGSSTRDRDNLGRVVLDPCPHNSLIIKPFRASFGSVWS